MENMIVSDCNKLINYYSQGADWIKGNATDDKKAVSLIELARLQKELSRLKEAALAKPTVAIFGPSQVGKSYLTSNLVKAPEANDLLITDPTTGEFISFIKQMNPYGGKESTGTITRFSINDKTKKKEGYGTKLLSAKDLICIIVNGYYLDIKKHTIHLSLDELNEQFSTLEKSISQHPSGILSENDIYEIKRYLFKNLGLNNNVVINKLTEFGFWEKAAKIAPYLSIPGIVLLFQHLWGMQPFLSDLFERLLHGLLLLDFNNHVSIQKDALTPNNATVLDVERVRELYLKEPSQLPQVGVTLESSKKASIDRRILAALTA
ncbi:MAG: virulence factor SrfC family protein [Saprospiraceae bacterium]